MIGLKENFADITLVQWLDRLRKDLKSTDLHEINFTDSIEDIDFKSYGHKDLLTNKALTPGEFPYTRGQNIPSNQWNNSFFIHVEDEKSANKKAMQVLMQGVDALIFQLGKQTVDFNLLLKDIGLTYIHTSFNVQTIEQVRAIIQGPLKEGKENTSISLDLNANPELISKVEELTSLVQNKQFPLFIADGYPIQQCGANITQELSFVLSAANEYLIFLTNSGLTIDEAAACIHFKIGIGSNYFQEIAKIRALRLLWSNVINQYHPVHSCSYNCRIAAQTGSMNKSAKDPNTNLLRQTTEAMSAVMGGVNELNVLPYDGETINGASSLAERMAINISLILKEESYLHAVIDPTGGSYSIEDLTQKFSKSAWETFQFLDKQGGIFNENAQKWMREQVTSTGIKRIELIKNKEKTLIGVNKFLNPQAENNSFGDYGTYFGLNKINFERDI